MNASDTTTHGALLAFTARGGQYALPERDILEVVTAARAARVPFAPPAVEGLANYGGRILVQVSLATLLDPGAATAADGPARAAGIVLILDTPGAPIALHVDSITGRVETAGNEAGDFNADAGDGSHFIRGEFHRGRQRLLLLATGAIGAVIQPATAGEAVDDADTGLLGRLDEDGTDDTETEYVRLLVFRLGNERHVVPLVAIQELVEQVAITAIPGAPETAAGVGVLRDEPLLFARLARLIGLAVESPAAYALIVGDETRRLGLLVDAIDGIENVPAAAIRLLEAAAGGVTGVVSSNQRIAGLVDVPSLLASEAVQALHPFLPAARQRTEARARHFVPHLELRVGAECYGIPLADTRRILPWSPPQALEVRSDRYVCGAINIDGDIVPVVDTAILHAQGSTQPTGAWLVVGDGQRDWALAIDEARRIVAVDAGELQDVGNGRGLVRAIANVDGRLLSILSVQPLLQGFAS